MGEVKDVKEKIHNEHYGPEDVTSYENLKHLFTFELNRHGARAPYLDDD